MLSEPPVQYAALFFLGLMVYTPVILFSTGKYKEGLKCAAAICIWMVMMATAVRVVATIYPPIVTSSATVLPATVDASDHPGQFPHAVCPPIPEATPIRALPKKPKAVYRPREIKECEIGPSRLNTPPNN